MIISVRLVKVLVNSSCDAALERIDSRPILLIVLHDTITIREVNHIKEAFGRHYSHADGICIGDCVHVFAHKLQGKKAAEHRNKCCRERNYGYKNRLDVDKTL